MKIQRIAVEGFKSNERVVSVDLSNEQASVIYGPNGCGKTTFLKAITALLAQDEQGLRDIGVNAIHCRYLHENIIKELTVRRRETDYDWSEYEDSPLKDSSSLSLGVDRGISTQTFKVDPETVYGFFRHPRYRRLFDAAMPGFSLREISEELASYLRRRQVFSNRRRSQPNSDVQHLYLDNIKMENVEEILLERYQIARLLATRKIQSALFDTLAIAISRDQPTVDTDDRFEDDLYSLLIENRERVIEALDDGSENNFKRGVMDILSTLDDESTYSRVQSSSLLKMLLRNILNELQVEKLMLNSINLLIDKFNGYLIGGKKLVVGYDKAHVTIGEKTHSIHELSSGERHMLTFLSLVLFSGRERNFLIIDEPEISLNLTWQRNLLDVFSELVPHTQIIVASHSPAMAGKNRDRLSELIVQGQ